MNCYYVIPIKIPLFKIYRFRKDLSLFVIQICIDKLEIHNILPGRSNREDSVAHHNNTKLRIHTVFCQIETVCSSKN